MNLQKSSTMGLIPAGAKLLLTVGIVWLCNMRGSDAQSPAMALEGAPAEVTITIPNNQLADSASYISIRLDNGHNLTDVLYSVGGQPKVKDEYDKKLTATQEGRRLRIQFRSVTADVAGTFKCYAHASSMVIDNCGQLLIVIRKPRPPVVRVLPSSSLVVGSRLQLLCDARSNSLPINHGLASEILWFDQTGKSIGSPGTDPKVRVNAQNQLVIEPLERAYKGRKFYCTTADSTGDISKRLVSDPSDQFEVTPEYGPAIEDFQLEPAFKHEDVVEKKTGDTITYRCDAVCSPTCTITWMFKPAAGSTDFSPVTALTDRKVLTLLVGRSSEGQYQCTAENKHGAAHQTFHLAVLYLEAPVVSINEKEVTSARVVEDTQVTLKCVFDSNPGPVVNWLSPTQTMLSTQKAPGPTVVTQGGLRKRLYTSTQRLDRLKCEDTGIYKCDGSNNIQTAEGRLELLVTCAPSGTDIPGLELKPEYVWEISQQLSIQFVIKAFPQPNITQIVSSLNGVLRKEEIPRDIEIVQTANYDGKSYLTKFGLTSKRKLDQSDTDRVYTMTIQSPDFTRDFSFHIHPRGPPHNVVNLTVIDVRHDSVILFWLPGFDGGENQTFSVEYRPYSEGESGTQQNVNVLAPAESLDGGAIFGIVFAVLILLIIIAAVLYFVVFKKRCIQPGSDGERE
ncbi:unnamed protein product, partial [Candidula unifasciata]